MLGEFLKKYRLKLNLKQSEMAEKIGTSQSYYSRIENSVVKPDINMIRKIAKALELEEAFIRSLV